jgi:hypothetical protein
MSGYQMVLVLKCPVFRQSLKFVNNYNDNHPNYGRATTIKELYPPPLVSIHKADTVSTLLLDSIQLPEHFYQCKTGPVFE